MGNRLYVGNLSFSSTTDTLRAAFSEIGEVTDVYIVTDRQTGRSRGFGFVTMGSDDAARDAAERMNGAMVDGRALRVNEAEDRPPRGGGGFGGGGGGFGGGGGGFGGGGGGGGFRRNGGGGGRGGEGGRRRRG
jgi:RNA recognition motif-containing protein